MSDVDPFYLNDTPESGDTSNASPSETDPAAPSQEQQPKESSQENLPATQKDFSKTLVTKGGNLADIVNRVSNDLVGDMPEETQAACARFMQRNAGGFAGALAMKCKGMQCPILDVCPLYETKQALPLGQRCPFEMGLIQTWVNKHLVALGIEEHMSPDNSFDMDILYELAANELIKWKAAHHIAKKGELIEERQVNVTPDGTSIFSEVLSPAVDLFETHSKITIKLREALLATRKAQIQAGKDMGDPSKKASTLAENARKKALARLGKANEEITDADYEVKEDST